MKVSDFEASVAEMADQATDLCPTELPLTLVKNHYELIKNVGEKRILAWAESLSGTVATAMSAGRYSGPIPDSDLRDTIVDALERYAALLTLIDGPLLCLELPADMKRWDADFRSALVRMQTAAREIVHHVPSKSGIASSAGLERLISTHQDNARSGIDIVANADEELRHLGSLISVVGNLDPRASNSPPELVSQAYKMHIMYLDDRLKRTLGSTKTRPKGIKRADIARLVYELVVFQSWPRSIKGYNPKTPYYKKPRTEEDTFKDKHTRNLSTLRNDNYERLHESIEALVGHPNPLTYIGTRPVWVG